MAEETDVYGGFEWAGLDLQATIAEAEMAYKWAQLQGATREQAQNYASDYMRNTLAQYEMMGYVPSSPLQVQWNPQMPQTPGFGAPTEDDAYRAIWENRSDIQQWYTQNWGQDVDPVDAMRDWARNTPEDIGDPLDFAYRNGYMDSPMYANGSGEYLGGSPGGFGDWPTIQAGGDLQKTLQRQNMEEQWRLAQEELGLRAHELGLMDKDIETNAALEYLGLLSQQQGPGDWVNYWNTTRGAQNTQLPAWIDKLVMGQGLQSWGRDYGGFGDAGVMTGFQANPGNYNPNNAYPQGAQAQQGQYPADNLPSWQDLATQVLQQRTTDNVMQGATQALGGMNPWQVNAQQWSNMLPSEQEGLAGAIDSLGGYSKDWLEQMTRSHPTGQYTALSYFQ